MKIIILGPPGSGKGTQSNLLMKKYNIPTISSGEALRNMILQKTQLSLLIEKKIQKGKLVDDNIITNLVIQEIQKKNVNHFILDGFPRTIQQVKSMEEKNISIDHVIELKLTKKIIYERILGRRIHKKSGRTYHIKYFPPKIPEQDDITQEKLTTRIDDNLKTINQRLLEYKQVQNVICTYYKNQMKKKKIKYIKINAELKIQEIFSKIENFIIKKQ